MNRWRAWGAIGLAIGLAIGAVTLQACSTTSARDATGAGAGRVAAADSDEPGQGGSSTGLKPAAAATGTSAGNREKSCAEAARRYRAELGAAAEGCLSDAGCVPLDTCHAVNRGRAPAIWQLRGQLQEICRGSAVDQVDRECAPRPTRCVASRCLRF